MTGTLEWTHDVTWERKGLDVLEVGWGSGFLRPLGGGSLCPKGILKGVIHFHLFEK